MPHERAPWSHFARKRVGIARALAHRMVRSVLLEQAAALLGVSRRTIYYRIRAGRLRTIRTRCGSQRVLIDSIEELLRERERKSERKRAARIRGRAAVVSDTDPCEKFPAP